MEHLDLRETWSVALPAWGTRYVKRGELRGMWSKRKNVSTFRIIRTPQQVDGYVNQGFACLGDPRPNAKGKGESNGNAKESGCTPKPHRQGLGSAQGKARNPSRKRSGPSGTLKHKSMNLQTAYCYQRPRW